MSVVVSVGHDNGPFRGLGIRVGCAISASKHGISTDFRVPKGPLISVRPEAQLLLGPLIVNRSPAWRYLLCGASHSASLRIVTICASVNRDFRWCLQMHPESLASFCLPIGEGYDLSRRRAPARGNVGSER